MHGVDGEMACAGECRVRRWTRNMCYPENRQEMRIKVELEFGGGGMEDRVGQTGYLYVSQLIK